MRRHEYESPYNPAVTELSRALRNDRDINPDTLDKITRVLEGVKRTDEIISQKDQLLLQKEQVIVQKESVINRKETELESTKQIVKKQGLRLEWQEGLTSNLFDTPFDLIRDEIVLQTRLKADATGDEQIQDYDQKILKLNKELVDEANRIKGEAITKSDHLRADILVQEAWKTDAEWYRREAVKNNDHGEYGVEFRNKQRIGCNQEIYKLIKELIGEANRIKGEAITSLDHLKADILIQEAWKTDAEWCRREVVKYNYHGEHGIEFRNKQLPEYDKEISRLVKELIGEANRIKGEAITSLDHLKADILIQEAWKTGAEWHRREAVKNNDNGEHGIEFRNRQLPEYDKEINRLTKELKSFEINKEEEIVKLKELLSIRELETQNKDQLLLAKELEKQELARLKEIEKEELLAQKEKEIHNKSLVKNQFIGELEEDIGLKEKEALNLKIELLTKQLEFKEKESELKEKALADAHIINELQGKLLTFKDLSKHDETLKLELSVIHFKVEESILNGNVDEMKELSKYLSQLMKDPIEKEESLEISELLNNLSPIVHVEANQVQNPLAVINNFDINHINTTHSVYPSGEGSESYEIL